MATPPTAPTPTVATVISSTRIDITWGNTGYYDQIDIWRKVGVGAYAWYRTLSGSAEYMEDSACVAETAYCYKARGIRYHPYGESDFSAEVGNCGTTFATLYAPSDVVATAISDIEIEITFKDNSKIETGHTLEREIDEGDVWRTILELEPNREYFRDGGLFLLAGGYVACVPDDIGKWVSDNGGNIGLLIEYDNARRWWLVDSDHTIANGETMTVVGGGGATGTIVRETKGLDVANQYTYRVSAEGDGGPVGPVESNLVTMISVPLTPVLDAILAADTQDKSIRIRWSDVDNETGYKIEHFIRYSTAFWSHVGLDAYDGTKVNDGVLNVAAFETDTSAANSFLKIDLGAGNDKEFMRVDLTIITASSNAIWDVEYSDDDAAWEKAKEDVGGAPLVVGTHEFSWTTVGAHRYWRLLKTNGAVAGGEHAEVQFYEQTGMVGIGVTDFLVTGLEANTEYTFRVRSYNAAGNSATYSAERVATTDAVYVPTVFEKWIRNPNIEPVYLAEIYTKMDLEDFTLEAGVTWKKTIDASDRGIDILEVFEDGIAYTEEALAAGELTNPNTFWFDYDNRILYVHTTGSGDPADFLIEGAFWLYFSTHKDIEFTVASGRLTHYLPFLAKEDIPDITQEIKAYFEGSFSISSGSIAFMNGKVKGEYFFDKKYATYTWENSKIVLKAGKDDVAFTYAHFKTILTSLIDKKSCNDSKITFTLRDIRQEMERDLILNPFNVTDYPDIDEDFIGEPIPICFGTKYNVVPIPIDIDRRKYKFHDGRSKSVIAVYKNFSATPTALIEDVDYFVDLQRSIVTFERDTFVLGEEDIIEVSFIGNVNSADEPIANGAEIFKYFMTNSAYYNLLDSDLNLDSIYRTKYEKTNELSIFLYKDTPYRKIVRSIEHSMEAFTFQDAEGRLGLRPQLATAESKAKYIVNHQIFNHLQSKNRKLLFWKVNVYYNENPQIQEWEVKSAQDDNIPIRYKIWNELNIYSYFSAPSSAQALADSIKNLLNKETIDDTVPMLLFNVIAGDIIKFSRNRFYSSTGKIDEGSEIDLRIIRISKSPASGKTIITTELV